MQMRAHAHGERCEGLLMKAATKKPAKRQRTITIGITKANKQTSRQVSQPFQVFRLSPARIMFRCSFEGDFGSRVRWLWVWAGGLRVLFAV